MDLFSGIGGFSLGLKRAGGFRTVAYCEIDPYCRQVLQQRMRDGALDTAPICTDVTRLDGKPWRGRVEVICGGFPCQDISSSNVNGLGIDGARSGLWREMARLVGEVRPSYLLVENVSKLLERGIGRVLGDLARLGYDAEWDNIPAALFGAPHRRERIWILAYPEGRKRLRETGKPGTTRNGEPKELMLRDLLPAIYPDGNYQASPRFAEWLMGFPVGWARSTPLETPSSPRLSSGLEGG
jgi:DNA (cytosine-5)-methyltransferase 1